MLQHAWFTRWLCRLSSQLLAAIFRASVLRQQNKGSRFQETLQDHQDTEWCWPWKWTLLRHRRKAGWCRSSSESWTTLPIHSTRSTETLTMVQARNKTEGHRRSFLPLAIGLYKSSFQSALANTHNHWTGALCHLIWLSCTSVWAILFSICGYYRVNRPRVNISMHPDYSDSDLCW